MRKITTLLLFCVVAFMGYADPVSKSAALQTAKDYLQKQRVTRGQGSPASELVLAYECMPKSARSLGVTTPLYYVFNNGQDGGFVVVAGDDAMTPVLGYVDQGTFEISKVHENLKWWLQAMEATMLTVVKSGISEPLPQVTDADLQSAVVPLVQVNWGQGKPYNDACPFDSVHDSRSLVGCTAVAMAQVLSKWKFPQAATGTVDYITPKHKLHLQENLSTLTYDWDKMLPSYAQNNGTPEERAAVANLMYACGLSMGMDYCAIASGAFLKSSLFEQHFGLAPTCNDVERLYFTRAEWDHLIKSELSAGRPVVYNGYSKIAGHSFVCDGYNADGLFHINWGWDGSLNGYFALAELNTAVEYAGAPTETEGNFNLDQSVVYGIQPAQSTTESAGKMLYFTHMKDIEAISRFNVKVTLVSVRADGNGFNGTFGLGIYDKNNEFMGCVGNTQNISLQPGYFYNEFQLGGKLPASLEDGTYTLRPVFLLSNGHYEPMRGRKGSGYVNHLTMTVNKNRVVLNQPELVDAKLTLVSAKPVADKVYAGMKNVLEVVLRNDGAMYNGPVTLIRKDADKYYYVYDNNYIIETGEELIIRAKVTAPEGVDTDSLQVWIAESDDDFYYTNGYYEKVVGDFSYQLTKVTPGAPKISVKKFILDKKTVHYEDSLHIAVNLVNTGGFYGGDFYGFIFPGNGGSSLGSGKKLIAMDKGDTLSFELQVPVANLSVGGYFLLPYISYGGQFVELTSTRFHFSKTLEDSFNISNKEGYDVYCVDYAFEVPVGVAGGVVTAADTTGLEIDYRYQSGDTIPANTAVILKADTRKTYKYAIVDSDEAAPADNLLTNATDEKGFTYAGEGDFVYYRFTYLEKGEHYGFYVAPKEGKPYRLPVDKCYLALPKEKANLNGYAFDGFETAVEEVQMDSSFDSGTVQIYTPAGVRISATFHQLPKGIYIVNGKKVMK